MKKLMSVVMICVLCVSLAGCGKSAAAPVAPPPESPASLPASDESLPASDENLPASDSAEDLPASDESLPASDEELPASDEAAEDTSIELAEAKGIIMLEADWPRLSALEYNIYSIDPDTTQSNLIVSFLFPDCITGPDKDSIVPGMPLFANHSDLFSEDLTKAAATRTVRATGETHAGWIDMAGDFFDVTEALGEQMQGDFDEIHRWTANGFQDGLFIYSLSDDVYKPVFYAVDLNNLAPGASWQIELPSKLVPQWVNDEQNDYPATEWLSETTYLGVNLDSRTCDIVEYDTTTDSAECIFSSDTRHAWSAVLSPDGAQIAILSAPTEASGAVVSVDLYTMPSDCAATPSKIETDVFQDYTEADAFLSYSTANMGYLMYQIIDWR